MVSLNEDSVWEEYLGSSRDLHFVCASSSSFHVVLHISFVWYSLHMAMFGWFPATVITFNSDMV